MAEEEKKELPPIVMIPEAQFVDKQLNLEFDKLKGTLGADIVTLDRAQTKLLCVETIARGEIADDDFNPIFDQMPKHEEDKEPLAFDDAKECVLRYAVSIKLIPSRLKTALDLYSTEFTQPERQIYDFFKNDSLTDVTLIHPTTGATYRVHRVIVASGSRYLLEAFTKHSVEDLPRIRVPEPFNQKNELHSDDQVSRILKYIYGNQNIGLIRDEINEENFYSLYAQAYSLGCERLLEDLCELSITSLLNERTVLKLYLDAVEHHEEKIMDACSQVITERFEEIINRENPQTSPMLSLNIENFISILRSDSLNLLNEEALIEIVRQYIEVREKVEPKKADTAEGQTPPELWALLTQDERDNRIAAWQEQQDRKLATEQEALNRDAEIYFAKDVTDRIQHVLDLKQKQRIQAIAEKSAKQKLTDEQKMSIFRCIRYAFLPHEALLKLSTDPEFTLAKEFIVQGLAYSLGGVKQMNSEDLKINVKPRLAYEVANFADAPAQEIVLEGVDSQSQQFAGELLAEKNQTAVAPVPPKKNNVGRDIFKQTNQGPVNMYESKFNQERLMRPGSSQGVTMQGRTASPISRVAQKPGQSLYANQANQRFNQVYQNQLGFQPGQPESQGVTGRTVGTRQSQSLAAKLLDESLQRDQNAITGAPFAQTMNMSRSAFNSRPPQRMGQSLPAETPTDFYFEYNFDENGVLYYLGSAGKRRNWQNPHSIGQVQAFASSIGPGCSVESFVGRSVQNCRTDDEPYSFFGVDLGMERRLVPTHYTLRNRNSTTHVLRNWYLEGSATGANWTILDARIYHSDSAEHNAALEQEFRDLKKQGGAMTFQIDTEIYRKLGYEGYRFFRIVQVGKNTNGTDNLALSGFELYGRVSGSPWSFSQV